MVILLLGFQPVFISDVSVSIFSLKLRFVPDPQNCRDPVGDADGTRPRESRRKNELSVSNDGQPCHYVVISVHSNNGNQRSPPCPPSGRIGSLGRTNFALWCIMVALPLVAFSDCDVIARARLAKLQPRYQSNGDVNNRLSFHRKGPRRSPYFQQLSLLLLVCNPFYYYSSLSLNRFTSSPLLLTSKYITFTY